MRRTDHPRIAAQARHVCTSVQTRIARRQCAELIIPNSGVNGGAPNPQEHRCRDVLEHISRDVLEHISYYLTAHCCVTGTPTPRFGEVEHRTTLATTSPIPMALMGATRGRVYLPSYTGSPTCLRRILPYRQEISTLHQSTLVEEQSSSQTDTVYTHGVLRLRLATAHCTFLYACITAEPSH